MNKKEEKEEKLKRKVTKTIPESLNRKKAVKENASPNTISVS